MGLILWNLDPFFWVLVVRFICVLVYVLSGLGGWLRIGMEDGIRRDEMEKTGLKVSE